MPTAPPVRTLEPSAEPTAIIEPEPTPTEPPPETPIPLICPSTPPTQALRVAAFLQLDTTCLGSATITIVGWQDDLPGIDFGEGGTIDPGWLIYPPATSVLYDRELTPSYSCRPINDCPILFVHIAPGSSLTFTGHNRWINVTGHVNDAASSSCHFVYPPGTPDSDKSPDELAVQACLTSFVLERIEAASAP